MSDDEVPAEVKDMPGVLVVFRPDLMTEADLAAGHVGGEATHHASYVLVNGLTRNGVGPLLKLVLEGLGYTVTDNLASSGVTGETETRQGRPPEESA